MRRYHEFHGRKDPATLGATHVTAFLSALATERRVAASTQNQALAALLFFYRELLGVELPWLDDVVRALGPERLPVVLSRDEVSAVLAEMHGVTWLMATMLYGSGLRLLECCRLRVKDVDSGRRQIAVRRGKGDKDRVTMLPAIVADDLAVHLERACARSTAATSTAEPAGSSYPTRSRASYRRPDASGPGNGSSPRRAATSSARPGRGGDTTCPRPSYSRRSAERCSRRASPSARRVTRSGTRSRRTCSRKAVTSVRCRSWSGTGT
jgi:integrase